MTERVEELRERYRNHGCSGAKCTDTCLLLAALAQAERELDRLRTDRLVALAAAQAEVERLKEDLGRYMLANNRAAADLARVRAAVPTNWCDSIMQRPGKALTDPWNALDVEQLLKRIHDAMQAALEGRG